MDPEQMAEWPNPFDCDDLQIPTAQQCGDQLYGPYTLASMMALLDWLGEYHYRSLG